MRQSSTINKKGVTVTGAGKALEAGPAAAAASAAIVEKAFKQYEMVLGRQTSVIT